jgi:hypothetical protein
MRHAIIESYTFANTINQVQVYGKNIRPEQLLLITDVTTGTVLYNFSDPSLGYTAYVNAVDSSTGLETCNITLAYNTAALSSTDKLSILVEESYDLILPNETMRDPVDKLRVSNPESLIDTDFEYSTQPGKWEALTLLNNRPSMFYNVTQPISNTATTLSFYSSAGGASSGSYTLTNVAASGSNVTVTLNNTVGIANGTPIFIQGTLDSGVADGYWLVSNVVANTSFQYSTAAVGTPSATLFNPNKTYIFPGYWYTGAAIPTGASAITLSGSVATVTTTNDHGLRVGDGIYITGTTGATGVLNSSWTVATTPTNNTFTFACTATGAITTAANVILYPRPLGYVESRPQLGAVVFTNLTPYHGYQTIRQTRRYFRYQAGKGVAFSTGCSLKPPLQVTNITSSGTTATVTTQFGHGLLNGSYVTISGCNESAYNGTFQVTSSPSVYTFTYTMGSTTTSPATGYPINANPTTWYGGSNRVGMFNDQNGFFFEWNGQTLSAVKRSATSYISGTVAVNVGSQSVTGTSTTFSTQLAPGDTVVISGMTYIVQQITSNTQMYIYPEYRGTNNIVSDLVTKVIDTKYAQSTWNIDKCDGTGASLFNADLTKMQMFYADYSWYGAGAIRFGFKNNRGEVIYCHRVPNDNLNQVAYLRSGNLPGRYETTTIPQRTTLAATLSSGATTGASISVTSTTGFPSSGTVVLTQAAATGAAIEYISYSAIVGNTFTITSRAQTGGNAAAQTFTYSATAPIRVELYSPQQASVINHWGSSVIIDGGFSNDKDYLINAGMNTALVNQTANVRGALMSVRLAPSADNGASGLFGVREIVNRMQLQLNSMDAFNSGNVFRIDLVLNGLLSAGTYTAVGGTSLAEICIHAANTTVTGGESIYSFFTNGTATTDQDLSQVRDLGTSILSGGNTFSVSTTPTNVYPDGPDVVTICGTPLGATSAINARISWVESQA